VKAQVKGHLHQNLATGESKSSDSPNEEGLNPLVFAMKTELMLITNHLSSIKIKTRGDSTLSAPFMK